MADIVNTMVSGFLAFCERPVYAYYQMEPNAFGIDLMVDQRAGAAAMWVIGSAVFLLPVMVNTLSMLQRQPEPRTKVQRACGSSDTGDKASMSSTRIRGESATKINPKHSD
jgi:hypothetical protein